MVHRKKIILFMMVFVIVAVIPLVSAAPPVTTTQQFANGFIIEDSPQTIFKKNQGFQINFFLYNQSNGLLVDNSSAECKYFLANSTGEIVYYTSVNYYTTVGTYGWWTTDILGGNLSVQGIYYYGIKCNSSTLGGATTGFYDVTYSGVEPSTPRAILNASMLFLLVGLFIFCIWLFFRLDNYKRTDEGKIIDINNLKYLKFPIFTLAYSMLLAIFFISANIGYGYLGDILFADFFFALFTIGMKIILPIIMVVTAWFFVQIVQDKKIKAQIERGVEFEGGRNQSVI